ncbi:hypothetical protein HU200_035488 [Digitaria exilis]|uniref:Uncharacterized protein n=1 Tax=Digitaria exilis TaxID=1010633 RepID=A0A835BTM4_9POAL|nr:hypothetical protein HU200_035488 [Digitaria exilis]
MLVWWLEMHGKIDSKMLSPKSTYCAYIVFKVQADTAYGHKHPEQKASVILGGNNSVRLVRLDDSDSDDEGGLEIPGNVLLPRERADGWKELELGEFYTDEGQDGEF